MIDENLKAWILEVNDHPSLNIYFDTSFMEAKKNTEEDICEVDLFVKSRLVTDTIRMVKQKRSELAQTHEFGSLTRLHPADMDSWEEATDDNWVFHAMLTLR